MTKDKTLFQYLSIPLTVVIRMKGFDKYSQTQRTEDSSQGRIQAPPLN